MPLYETMFICRQDMTPDAVSDLSKNLEAVIKDGEGKVEKTDNWGLKTLAYKIQKNRKGYYVLMNIDAPAPAVLEMERAPSQGQMRRKSIGKTQRHCQSTYQSVVKLCHHVSHMFHRKNNVSLPMQSNVRVSWH